MTLIDHWRAGWKFWSARFSFVGLLLQLLALVDWNMVLGTFNMMPAHVRLLIPESVLQAASAILFALALAARFIAQPKARALIEERNHAGE